MAISSGLDIEICYAAELKQVTTLEVAKGFVYCFITGDG